MNDRYTAAYICNQEKVVFTMNMFLLLLKGGYEKYVIAIYCDKMIL